MREWIRPDSNVSKTKLDTAGCMLIGKKPPGAPLANREEALAIIGRWRSAHSWPLNTVRVALRRRVEYLTKTPLLAQRLKRLSSIDAKLRRFPAMQLSQMQDIGGCRAVLPTVEGVEELFEMYESDAKHHQHRRQTIFVRKYDYLTVPKSDGYRGVHIVFRYRSRFDKNASWDGMKVEVQLRSGLQHAWATAVETVSTFTGQQLKSNIGEDKWKRFFALMSSALAMREGCATVPGTPGDRREIVRELRRLNKTLKVDAVLSGFQNFVHFSGQDNVRNARFYLVVLDAEARSVTVHPYMGSDQAKASAEYLEVEKAVEKNPNLNAVLASVDSITGLRAAFPNYYFDTTAFRAAVAEVMGE
jgi:ppGpp synthetase/RelA/SpoT-type nucleotidyltranferase